MFNLVRVEQTENYIEFSVDLSSQIFNNTKTYSKIQTENNLTLFKTYNEEIQKFMVKLKRK